MKNKFILFVFASFCAHSFETKKEAQEVLMPFKKELMKTLKTSFKNGGVAGAVDKCHVEAPKIAVRHSSKTYEIGRTSHKFRNPNNKPEKWMEGVLSDYERSKSKEGRIVVQDGVSYYVEPIYVKGLCLNCHGNLSERTQKLISSKYPEDKAHGYKINDFRGVFWLKSK